MPIYLPMSGVNTKQKTVYASMSGVNTKMKTGYGPINGVNTKVFSGINHYTASISGEDVYGRGTVTNTSTLTGGNLHVQTSVRTSSNQSAMFAVILHIIFEDEIPYSDLSLNMVSPSMVYSTSDSSSSTNSGGIVLRDEINRSNAVSVWHVSSFGSRTYTTPNPTTGSGAFSGTSKQFAIEFSIYSTKAGAAMSGDVLLSNITICGVPLIAA